MYTHTCERISSSVHPSHSPILWHLIITKLINPSGSRPTPLRGYVSPSCLHSIPNGLCILLQVKDVNAFICMMTSVNVRASCETALSEPALQLSHWNNKECPLGSKTRKREDRLIKIILKNEWRGHRLCPQMTWGEVLTGRSDTWCEEKMKREVSMKWACGRERREKQRKVSLMSLVP